MNHLEALQSAAAARKIDALTERVSQLEIANRALDQRVDALQAALRELASKGQPPADTGKPRGGFF